MKSSRRKTFPESGLNWFACCLAILCLSSSAWALAKPDLKASFNKDELMAGDKEVEIYADSLQYLRKTNTYHARGSVDIKRENYRLRADKAELNDLTGEMLATGNVILDESDNRVTAERVEYNLNTGTGTFYQAQVFLSPSYFITGAVIKKLSETVYELNDGTYTTCRQLTPDWRFKVGHARVLVDKKACLTNNLFYLKWLPVFYVPYAEVPLKRTSGFLMPQAGTTDFFGRYTRNTFFWNIADWVDTTLRYDFSEKKGNGYGMEARYALSDKSKFNGTGYHIEEKDTKEKRWEGHINMEQELPLGFLAIFRLDNYSDRDYNKDYLFSNNVLTGNYSRWQQEQISYFSLTKNWDNFRFNTVVENRKNLANYPFASDDDDIDATVVNVTTNNYSIWRYPQITFTALPQKILDTPLNFQGTASYLKYEKITSNETVRKDDNSPVSLTVDKTRNERYHFQPELFMPLQPVPWFSITPRIGADYTEWEKNFRGIKKISEINGVRQDSSPLKSDKMYRKYVFYSVKTYGPEIYRNYNAHALFGVDFIKHSLFPTVTYTKVPLMQKNLRNKVINFDPIDSSAEQESINYQLTQNLLGTFLDHQVRQLATFTVSQSYNWVEERRWFRDKRKNTGNLIRPLRPYSPVNFQLKTQILDGFNVDWDMDYDIYHEKTSRTNLLARARYKNTVHMRVGWRFQRNINETVVNDKWERYDTLTDSVNLHGDILLFDHLKIDSSIMYKIDDTEIKTRNKELKERLTMEKKLRKKRGIGDGTIQPLDFMVKLTWISQCWSFGVSFRRTFNPVDPLAISASSNTGSVRKNKDPFQDIVLFYVNLYGVDTQAF